MSRSIKLLVMADSREEHGGGQAPMLCQICEIARGIEWKCLDCDLLMCQKCKEKIHPKFKLANEHKIVNIKDVGHKEVQIRSCEEEIYFGNIKCTEHSEETCCLYCKVCDKLICMQCVTKTHKSHIFEEISNGYSIRKENLKKHAITLKEQDKTLTNDIEKLIKIKEEDKLQSGQVKKEITTHEKSVKDEVEQYTKSLIDELDTKWGSRQTAIDKEIDRVNELKIKIQQKVKKSEDVMNIKEVTDFFQKTEEIKNYIKEDVQISPLEKDSIPSFISGKLCQNCNFGNLKSKNEMDEEKKSSMKIELKIGKKYSTNLLSIMRVKHSID
ncbi:E3 ubiquitin-protein ligase TRIM33-like [Mytilus californianus]|uniref:E3 ubiquitin-protein ligase TRIM33-like n=1 Tax=Mytilus californianus TaxID=6549 RepID=UPI00224647D1|nr:E3 ubiquitin-protein ligase TRIM33-like [Mytilus californianus]